MAKAAPAAKRTKSQVQAQIEALQAELEGADDDEEVSVIVEKDGARTTLTGSHAAKWLRRLGLDDDDDQGDGDDGDGDDDGDDDDDPPPSQGVRGKFFGGAASTPPKAKTKAA